MIDMRFMKTVPCLLLALVLPAACGSEEPIGPDDDPTVTPDQRYLPFAVGASWTYRVTDPQNPTGPAVTKVNTVEAHEAMDGANAGTMAYRLRTQFPDRSSVSWQAYSGTRVIRYRDRTYDERDALRGEDQYEPYKLRLDEKLARDGVGATMTTTHRETMTDRDGTRTIQKSERWTVEAVDEEITVPAGTYRTLRVRRTSTGEGSDKTFWFAAGVGKIKETGGQTEELVSYTKP
jgi:hypothetical protein